MAVSQRDVTPIIAALSPERLASYGRATADDDAAAVRLYAWNLAASGALYEALSVAEVVLRNALSAQLTVHHGDLPGHWYDDPRDVLTEEAHTDIAVARARVRKKCHPETPGRVAAELGFGFWKFLLARRYESTLWTGHLRHAFPHLRPQKRATVHAAVDDLHLLRNRVAHQEPIHGRDLNRDVVTLYRLLQWIDPDVRIWAVSLSRLPHVLAARPV
jgi:hypothetical protein